ncbi:MAG: efflux RND transporter permease subunit, partial [Myxococcota bacterium]
ERMAALDISPAEVRGALAQNNFLAPVGRTKGALIQVNLTANTNLTSVEEFEELVVRQAGGALVRLGDIARVELGAENYETEVRFSGTTAVFMGIFPLPNANALDVIERVREEMEGVKDDLPAGMEADLAYDATEYIEDALSEVGVTMVETLVIVILVIFLFMGSLRSVLVPVVAIPVSLIGAVFLMQVFGFTVNLLTLLAIVLSVGLVVDDAIVMVENVDRHLSEGMSPLAAGQKAARELAGPVISMTLTLAAVYAPIGLQGGLTGALFREFAFTLAGAVLISGVVALTLSPIMSAKLLKEGQSEQGFTAFVNRGFSRLKDIYGRLLDKTLAARPAVYLLWIGFSLLGIVMY